MIFYISNFFFLSKSVVCLSDTHGIEYKLFDQIPKGDY